MCPAILRFEEAYGGIQSEPISIGCERSERPRMNFVHHDVDVEVLLVVVRNDQELVALISECLQCV